MFDLTSYIYKLYFSHVGDWTITIVKYYFKQSTCLNLLSLNTIMQPSGTK